MSLLPPPLNDPIMSEDGEIVLPWIRFFNQSYIGDVGTEFTPTITGMTGTVTASGRFYKLSQELAFIRVNITPTGSMTSTAGVTYCDVPFKVNANGVCAAVGGAVGIGLGIIQTNRRMYFPGWSGVTVPVTILGLVEAK